MTGPVWSAGGVEVRRADEHRAVDGVLVSVARREHLTAEAARSLASWLLWSVGDRPRASQPDKVRAAIDEQRQQLRRRSAAAETSEDFRSGLAWCEHALDEIARAAS